MAAKHTPPGDDGFRVSLLRNLGGGAGLIALVAVVFLGIGQLSGEGVPEVAGTAGDTRETADADAGAGTEEASEDPEESEDHEASERAREPDDDGAGVEPEEAAPAAEDDGDDGERAGDDGDGETAEQAGDDAAAPEPEGVAPGDISVQVLDGVGTDGGAAAERVAGELDEAGYRIIARNPALAYEETTVLWTRGNEDRARQVAAELGVSAVRAQPGNLSEQVDVHVVVGADRA